MVKPAFCAISSIFFSDAHFISFTADFVLIKYQLHDRECVSKIFVFLRVFTRSVDYRNVFVSHMVHSDFVNK